MRRRLHRQTHAKPLLLQLQLWLNESLSQPSAKSPIAAAIGYALGTWRAFNAYAEDGRIEMGNNTAERALRGRGAGAQELLALRLRQRWQPRCGHLQPGRHLQAQWR